MRIGIFIATLLASTTNSPCLARINEPLNTGWRFHFEDAGAGLPVDTAFKDNAWEPVSLPHTWNRLGEYALNRSSASDNRQGVGWYRLTYPAQKAVAGSRFWLDFGAVGNVADIWVNGVSVCGHKGAFSRFRCDVTAKWRPGQINLVAVRADNSRPKIGSTTQDVIPLGGDFFIHGGLYRGVSLITTGPRHLDLGDHGGPGIYARQISLSSNLAEIEVRSRIANDSTIANNVIGVVKVTDAAGVVVATAPFQQRVGGSTVAEVVTRLQIANPHRWDGRRDPYL